jgi:hypothetical protein
MTQPLTELPPRDHGHSSTQNNDEPQLCIFRPYAAPAFESHTSCYTKSMTATVTTTLSFREKGLAAQSVAYGGGAS